MALDILSNEEKYVDSTTPPPASAFVVKCALIMNNAPPTNKMIAVISPFAPKPEESRKSWLPWLKILRGL